MSLSCVRVTLQARNTSTPAGPKRRARYADYRSSANATGNGVLLGMVSLIGGSCYEFLCGLAAQITILYEALHKCFTVRLSDKEDSRTVTLIYLFTKLDNFVVADISERILSED
ncbi:hypothetical protein ElyMa_003733400 [Elysia marginata]|uniref:Uncharacterized protein n=1 Tax=Elysia marginata TaxID=1093978 RepID=A0AAV4F666_9GAST|nr:hypothetical protein ElyMa_003733400 [Elysia marginata]